ncbi:MAG: hypothetical protein WCI41_01160 [bacterium]
MFSKIILNLFVGFLIGFILEFFYRSIQARKIVAPKFINYQMYGLTALFLSLLYFLNISFLLKLILIFIFPTLIEFLTGYLYFKIKKIRSWDYRKELYNYKGLICLKFSIIWFLVALSYYYLLIPPILNL